MQSALTIAPAASKRCAIYTRKSSEHGLHQDFNSLKAQHAICSAYIQSQQHKGWIEVPRVYEDAAQSGASLDRPALKELLGDIERGRIDAVVVYKLDRLSRSLLDFIRLMDVFERYGVSFACITQNFDTADSLGRLVMNVLLTFAQFEREMTGDRIRDKRQAMAFKGLWNGGRPPIGYDLVNHKLIVNPREAAIVRHIYETYLECGTLRAVARSCGENGFCSKTYTPATGVLHLGVPLKAAAVRKILMNPIYAGYVHASGKLYRGIHQSIISPGLWQRVTDLREEQIASRAVSAPREVLDGLMYDCFGRSMTANRLFKSGKLHVHYRSNQNAWGMRNNVKRMRASSQDTEKLVVSALQNLLCDREQLRSLLLDLGRHGIELAAACNKAPGASRRLETISRDQLRSVLHGLIVRIEVSRERLKIVTRALEYEPLLDWDFVGLFRRRAEDNAHSPTHLINVPCAGGIRLERFVRLPIVARKPQTYRMNKRLRALISEARKAWALVETNRDLAPADIARQCNMSLSFLMRLLRLNYLAPDIVTSILDGAQPRELTRRALIDANLPLDWALQRKMFGFPAQPPMRTNERSY
jgi:DNA invertase Pin-like site-specific DNA recombinase